MNRCRWAWRFQSPAARRASKWRRAPGEAAQRGKCPDRPDRSEPPVFDMPVCHNDFLAAGAGDGGGSGKGFQPAGIGETGAVVADLGQYPGTGQNPQPGEAGDDRGVRVLLKMGDRRLGELLDGRAGGLELAQQRPQLNTHRVFHLWWLMQVGVGEHRAQPLDVAVEVTAAAGLDQQPAQPRRGQLGGLGGCRCGGQDGARIRARESAWAARRTRRWRPGRSP